MKWDRSFPANFGNFSAGFNDPQRVAQAEGTVASNQICSGWNEFDYRKRKNAQDIIKNVSYVVNWPPKLWDEVAVYSEEETKGLECSKLLTLQEEWSNFVQKWF